MKKTIEIAMMAVILSSAAWAGDFKAINVGPLVSASWNQNSPYTDFAPVNRSTHQHLYNGCVAVALSQVMHHWRWPTRTDDTWAGKNMADGVPGFEQQLLAGTEIDWASMLDDYVVYGSHKPTYGELLALGKGQILTSIVVEMEYKKEASGADASRFAFNPWYARPTEMNNLDGAQDSLPYEERYAKVRTALTNGIPLLCTIDVAMSGKMVGHEIVVDGWKETNETDGQVHLNYGWGGYNDQWVSFEHCNVKSFMFGFVPRPKVIPEPILAAATLPVSVRWHFPTRGYEKTLKGFEVSYAEATEETETWYDDFETQKGSFWGALITREIVANSGEDSTVLRIDNESDRSTYTWPAQLLGKGAELSFRYRSDHARNQSVMVEAYEAAHGWRTLETLELNEADVADWMPRTISLAAYAGKATAIRFRTERAGVGADTAVGGVQFGVQIDDVQITNMRKLKAAKTLHTDADLRACSLGSDVLSVGNTYVITVAPYGVANGEAGYGVATTIVSEEPEKVAITGVQSIHSDDYPFNAGIFRQGYIGTNQFAVYTSASTTKLRATLSHPALIDQTLIDDVAVPGTQTLAPTAVTLVAPKVEQGTSGKWLVTLDFSNLTEASLNAQEMVMLEAEDDLGNVVRKEVIFDLVALGNETAISADAIPDYTGTPETEDDAPATPVETTCLVLFEANGGDGTVAVAFDNGDTIAFPTVTCAGYTLDGWYTLAVGGTKVDAAAKVTKSATYYAHWVAASSGGDEEAGGEDEPDEPSEETPVITPTFPVAADAGPNDDPTAMTRFCPGVTASAGCYDVARSGSSNRHIPVAYNLVYWWVDRYKATFGKTPEDYTKPDDAAIPYSEGTYTIVSYTAKLLDDAFTTTLHAANDRLVYFPAAAQTAAAWHGDGDEATWAKTTGKAIYAALANGPIGCNVATSAIYGYAATIWGCEYAEEDGEKYATALYITDTTSSTRSDVLVRKTFDLVENNSGVRLPGIKAFNSSNAGTIEDFYPISAPQPEASGEGEVTVRVTAGGKEYDISKAFSKVEKGAGNVVTYTLDATPGKTIAVGGEQIAIQPELADGDGETPFAMQGDKLVFTVKSIPGLKYQVMASDSLDPDSFQPAGQEREAIGTRRELTVTHANETKGFFKIQVSR